MARTLKELISEQLGVEVYSRDNPEIAAVSQTALILLRQNPNRVAFTLYNLSGNAMHLGPWSDPSSTKGFRAGPNGGGLSMIYSEDFDLPGREWFIVADGDDSNLLIVEQVTR